jgi:hypothetical protein
MTDQPLGQLVLVLDVDQVHGVLLVSLCESEGAQSGRGIGGIDPIDEGLLVPEDQGRSIEQIVAPGDQLRGSRGLKGTQTFDQAQATSSYSWMRPPRRSRLRTR